MFKVEELRAGSWVWSGIFDIQHSTFDSSPAPNGGFVPDSAKRRSFLINQLGGFVFQKVSAFSRQPSDQVEPLKVEELRTGPWVWTLRHTTFDLRLFSCFASHEPKEGSGQGLTQAT